MIQSLFTGSLLISHDWLTKYIYFLYGIRLLGVLSVRQVYIYRINQLLSDSALSIDGDTRDRLESFVRRIRVDYSTKMDVTPYDDPYYWAAFTITGRFI
jgi:CHAT domain-containing protein